MFGISINDHKLHEIRMLLVPFSPKSIAYLQYPKDRINLSQKGEIFVLKIPAFLGLELYRRGILSSHQANEKFTIKISGKKLGDFLIVDFRYPHDNSEEIFMSLKKV